MLEQCWNLSLEDGNSAGAGLVIPFPFSQTLILEGHCPTEFSSNQVSSKDHCTRRLKFANALFCFFFLIRHPFLSKCLLQMQNAEN